MRTINNGFLSEDIVEEELDNLEIFCTLTALSKPLSPAVHHKCSCESCFKDAIILMPSYRRTGFVVRLYFDDSSSVSLYQHPSEAQGRQPGNANWGP